MNRLSQLEYKGFVVETSLESILLESYDKAGEALVRILNSPTKVRLCISCYIKDPKL